MTQANHLERHDSKTNECMRQLLEFNFLPLTCNLLLSDLSSQGLTSWLSDSNLRLVYLNLVQHDLSLGSFPYMWVYCTPISASAGQPILGAGEGDLEVLKKSSQGRDAGRQGYYRRGTAPLCLNLVKIMGAKCTNRLEKVVL